MKLRLEWIACVLLSSCGGVETPPDAAVAGDAVVPLDAGESEDAAASTDAEQADSGAPADDHPHPWCARIVPGGAGAVAIPLALSAAHAELRFFGAERDYDTVDRALAGALDLADALEPSALRSTLAALVAPLESACSLPASTGALGVASVEWIGTIAVVHPGAGAIAIGEGATAAAIDLRDLPAVPELEETLRSALAPLLEAPIDGVELRTRFHDGMTDEIYPNNVYFNQQLLTASPELAASGTERLPLFVLTAERMPPAATQLAAALRAKKRAWIVGRDLDVAAGEVRWHPIGEQGLAFRTFELFVDSVRLPDVIPADVPSDDANAALASIALGDFSAEPGPVGRTATRWPIRAAMPSTATASSATDRGSVRAALLIAHGALRLFYPYFPVVGDHIDERLSETLEVAGQSAALPGIEISRLLRRFGEVLKDGHNSVFTLTDLLQFAGYMPMVLEQIDGQPIVRRSLRPELPPGTRIVTVDGESVGDWFAREYTLTSAATDGFRFTLASYRLQAPYTPRTLGLEYVDGSTAALEISTIEEADDVFYADEAMRPTGSLADLGSPDVMLVNMTTLTGVVELTLALTATTAWSGMIVDMRGYPTIDHYAVAERLIPGPFQSAHFAYTNYSSPDEQAQTEVQYDLAGTFNAFDAPIVLLVGPRTISAAENFAMMLVGARRLEAIVGRQSGGTNGNSTGLVLPTGFAFRFTGLEVLFPDRSLFHGVGIVPDMVVEPTRADLALGQDIEIEAALEILRR